MVAAPRVVRPPLVPADVDGAVIGGGGQQRVAAGVVDPLMGQSANGGARECRDRVAQAGEREVAVPVIEMLTGGGDVDGGHVGRPGGGFDIERVPVHAVLAELLGVPVADVPVPR